MQDILAGNRMWLLLTVPACVVGIALIIMSVRRIVGAIRVRELLRVSLVAEQDVDLTDPGPLVFVVDKPRFRRVQASLFKPFAMSVSLENAATGQVETASSVLMPFTVEGISRIRYELASLQSIKPGRYRLRVAGLAPDFADADSFLLIARPMAKLMLVSGILGAIAGGFLAVGGIVFSILLLTGRLPSDNG